MLFALGAGGGAQDLGHGPCVTGATARLTLEAWSPCHQLNVVAHNCGPGERTNRHVQLHQESPWPHVPPIPHRTAVPSSSPHESSVGLPIKGSRKLVGAIGCVA